MYARRGSSCILFTRPRDGESTVSRIPGSDFGQHILGGAAHFGARFDPLHPAIQLVIPSRLRISISGNGKGNQEGADKLGAVVRREMQGFRLNFFSEIRHKVSVMVFVRESISGRDASPRRPPVPPRTFRSGKASLPKIPHLFRLAQTSGLRRLGGRLPDKIAVRFFTARRTIFMRVAWLALPMCGASTTLSKVRKPGFSLGSPS